MPVRPSLDRSDYSPHQLHALKETTAFGPVSGWSSSLPLHDSFKCMRVKISRWCLVIAVLVYKLTQTRNGSTRACASENGMVCAALQIWFLWYSNAPSVRWRSYSDLDHENAALLPPLLCRRGRRRFQQDEIQRIVHSNLHLLRNTQSWLVRGHGFEKFKKQQAGLRKIFTVTLHRTLLSQIECKWMQVERTHRPTLRAYVSCRTHSSCTFRCLPICTYTERRLTGPSLLVRIEQCAHERLITRTGSIRIRSLDPTLCDITSTRLISRTPTDMFGIHRLFRCLTSHIQQKRVVFCHVIDSGSAYTWIRIYMYIYMLWGVRLFIVRCLKVSRRHELACARLYVLRVSPNLYILWTPVCSLISVL